MENSLEFESPQSTNTVIEVINGIRYCREMTEEEEKIFDYLESKRKENEHR